MRDPEARAAHHTHAAIGVFRLKDGGYGARWAGAFFAADDGDAPAEAVAPGYHVLILSGGYGVTCPGSPVHGEC